MRHSAVPASWRAIARQPVPLAAKIPRRTPGLGGYVRSCSDAAELLYTSEALVAAFKSRQRVEQRGPDALLHRNDQRGLQGRIRGLQRAGGGARLIHDGLGGAADIEELLDPGSVLGPYGVLELLERLEGRAPS